MRLLRKHGVSSEEIVIEIGPGLGTLTERLAGRACKVVCIELDRRMVQVLQDRFLLYDNVEIVNSDVLKIDLNKLIFESGFKYAKVVANLPYYITTPIVMKLLEENVCLDSVTVMVQKEVADRLCAKTGTREAGAITYAVEYYSNAKKLIEVPRSSFVPAPNVDSEVISLEIVKEKYGDVKSKERLFEVIKYAFMQRRKTLTNALQNLGIDKDSLVHVLDGLGINPQIRGEALSLEQFIQISNQI